MNGSAKMLGIVLMFLGLFGLITISVWTGTQLGNEDAYEKGYIDGSVETANVCGIAIHEILNSSCEEVYEQLIGEQDFDILNLKGEEI